MLSTTEANMTSSRSRPQHPTNHDAPWFDKECAKLKEEINKIGKNLAKEPNNHGIREHLYIEKRRLHTLVKNKKMKYKYDILEQLEGYETLNTKKYWKLLDKLSPKHTNGNTYVSQTEWIEHYTKLLSPKRPIKYPPDSIEEGELDYEITLYELEKAILSLKDHKSPGVDNISNEMIECFYELHPNVLFKFLNLTLKMGGKIPKWSKALLVPIFKTGEKENPEN